MKQPTQSQQKKSKSSKPILTIVLLTLSLTAAGIMVYCVHKNAQLIEASYAAMQKTDAETNKLLLENKLAKIAEEKRLAEEKAAAEAKAKAEAEAQAKQNQANNQGVSGGVNCRPVANSASITVVVNKKYCFSPIDWKPSDLVSVGGGHYLRREAAEAYQKMRQAAQNDGLDFTPSSSYRSYATQQSTYQYWVRVNGSAAIADTVSARAGFSEHQTGLVADFQVNGCQLECFNNKPAYHWLVQHAADYGFIQRYHADTTPITGYAAESWHWRYVGVNVAKDMRKKGIKTLEEYFGIEGGDYL